MPIKFKPKQPGFDRYDHLKPMADGTCAGKGNPAAKWKVWEWRICLYVAHEPQK